MSWFDPLGGPVGIVASAHGGQKSPLPGWHRGVEPAGCVRLSHSQVRLCFAWATRFSCAAGLSRFGGAEEPPQGLAPALRLPRLWLLGLFRPGVEIPCRLVIDTAAPAPAETQVPPHRDRPTLPLPVGQLGPFQPLRPVGEMNLLDVVGFAGSIIT